MTASQTNIIERKRQRCVQVGSEGFTLMEVLIAFVILAFSLFALFQSIAQGSRSLALSTKQENALMLARAKLAELTILGPLDDQPTSGMFENGYRWNFDPGEQSKGLRGRWVHLEVVSTGRGNREQRQRLTTFILEVTQK